VRVNGLLWQEVSHLFDRGPKEHIYVTRSDESGKIIVQFGNGQIGARLPSGRDNVQASYRKGIGLAGFVKAGQIANLMTRSLGVKGVVNPLPSAGAEDPEALEDARRNAPLNVMTLGKIVSLQDYEDFARAFAGVAKALATWTWNGERRVVLLTVAGPKGSAIESDLHDKLLEAMRSSGDPRIPINVKSYSKASFRMKAEVKVDQAYQTEIVLAEVKSVLRDRFSFEAREFGQPVTYDEVMATMQEVPGVIAVNVKALYRSDKGENKDEFLPAKAPVAGGTEAEASAAELLTLESSPFDLEVMA
jgi:predicted phage baseplate assembly protein